MYVFQTVLFGFYIIPYSGLRHVHRNDLWTLTSRIFIPETHILYIASVSRHSRNGLPVLSVFTQIFLDPTLPFGDALLSPSGMVVH
jgi:hypothetical protein